MRGIEPRSEEKTTRTSTSIVCSNDLTYATRSKLGEHMLTRKDFAPEHRVSSGTIPAKSTPFCSPPGAAAEDGLLYLSSQCVVVVCTYCFSALLTCNSESTRCCS